MSQQQDIEERGPAGLPIVKFREIGQTFIGALVDAETRQQMNFKNGKADGLAFKDDGKPAMEKILYLLVMPGTTAMQSSDDDPSGYAPLEVKSLVRVILKGFKWGQYIDARNETPGLKGEKTGDIFTCTYKNGSKMNKAGGRDELHTEAEIAAQPREVIVGKDMVITLARPGAHQDAVIDACNNARTARKAQPVGDEVAPGAAAAAAPAVDEAAMARLTPLQRQAIANAQNTEIPF